MEVKKVERQSRSTQEGPALAVKLRHRCVTAASPLRARCVLAASPLRPRSLGILQSPPRHPPISASASSNLHPSIKSSNLRLGILQSQPRHPPISASASSNPPISIQSLDSHYLILILKHRIHRNQRFIIIIQAIIITCSIESIIFAHIQLNIIYYQHYII